MLSGISAVIFRTLHGKALTLIYCISNGLIMKQNDESNNGFFSRKSDIPFAIISILLTSYLAFLGLNFTKQTVQSSKIDSLINSLKKNSWGDYVSTEKLISNVQEIIALMQLNKEIDQSDINTKLAFQRRISELIFSTVINKKIPEIDIPHRRDVYDILVLAEIALDVHLPEIEFASMFMKSEIDGKVKVLNDFTTKYKHEKHYLVSWAYFNLASLSYSSYLDNADISNKKINTQACVNWQKGFDFLKLSSRTPDLDYSSNDLNTMILQIYRKYIFSYTKEDVENNFENLETICPDVAKRIKNKCFKTHDICKNKI